VWFLKSANLQSCGFCPQMDKFDRYPTDDEITFAKRNGKVAIFDKVQGTFDLDLVSVGAWRMIEAP
jgi:hypothetical protein